MKWKPLKSTRASKYLNFRSSIGDRNELGDESILACMVQSPSIDRLGRIHRSAHVRVATAGSLIDRIDRRRDCSCVFTTKSWIVCCKSFNRHLACLRTIPRYKHKVHL